MRDDAETVHGGDSDAPAIGKAQPATDGLLDKNPSVRRPQGNNRVKVRHIPTFLEHVDVDHDLRGILVVLHREEICDHFFLVRAGLAAVHLDNLVLVTAFEKIIRLNHVEQCLGVGCVPGDHQHEGFHDLNIRLTGVGFEQHLGLFVHADAIHQLHFLNGGGRHAFRIEVLPRDHGGLLHKAIIHRLS